MKRKKIILYSAIILVVAVAGFWFLKKDNTARVVTYKTSAVVRGSISNTVTATGTVEPLKQVEVGTQVSGVIKKIYVDFNSRVKTGQLLAELDKTPLLAQLSSAQAELEAANSQLTYQEANFNRIKLLFDKKAVSETDYEAALYQYSNAKATVSKMKSEVDRARTNLGYAMIYSPIDGVVLNRAVDEGQTVAASFNTPTLFTIAQDLTKMQVVANVDEADIGQVAEGQKVTFTVDAFPDEVFQGTVTQVRLQATTTSNVVTYSVVIDAPNPDLKLKPGLTASITAYTREAKDVLVIPSKALRFNPESDASTAASPAGMNQSSGGSGSSIPSSASAATPPAGKSELSGSTTYNQKSVWVKDGNSIRKVLVETGITDETNVEIKSGLNEGELVILSMEQSTVSQAKSDDSATKSPFMPKRPGKK